MAPIVQTLWIGRALSTLERLSLASFLAHGHEVHLYVYDDVAHVPEGVVTKDAGEILPRDAIFRHHEGSYAHFADWFRFELIYRNGHCWVDTDVICLKPFEFADEWVFARQGWDQVGVSVLRFPRGHELVERVAFACQHPNRVMPWDTAKTRRRKRRRRLLFQRRTKWGEAGGPIGLTLALRHYGVLDKALPHTAFYPVHWQNWDSLYDETHAGRPHALDGSYAVHLWNEMQRRVPGFDKDATFPEGSLVEQLKRRYL